MWFWTNCENSRILWLLCHIYGWTERWSIGGWAPEVRSVHGNRVDSCGCHRPASLTPNRTTIDAHSTIVLYLSYFQLLFCFNSYHSFIQFNCLIIVVDLSHWLLEWCIYGAKMKRADWPKKKMRKTNDSYSTRNNSTSKINVAFGGMTPGWPLLP